MGHEVFDAPVPATNQVSSFQLQKIKAQWPTEEQLESCDVILLCGAEYLEAWIRFIYPNWDNCKVSKAGWFHESLNRNDRAKYEDVLKYIDVPYLPNPDDAEKKKAKWLPIGVDTQMFSASALLWETIEACTQIPDSPKCGRDIDCAFVGLLYEKREQYLKTLRPHLSGVNFTVGNVMAQDLGGINIRKSAEMLADSYRRMKILLNLPSLSDVLVMKVLEGMACGTLVVTPELPSKLHDLLGFETKHLAFYQPGKPQAVGDTVKYFLNNQEEREAISHAGMMEVLDKHRIESRLEVILEGK